METTIKESRKNSKVPFGESLLLTNKPKNGLTAGFLRVSEEVYIALIITLVAFLGFGLGRFSMVQKSSSKTQVKLIQGGGGEAALVADKGVSVVDTGTTGGEVSTTTLSATEVVASKQGTKYHYTWCPGASKISPSNKISFTSEAAAIVAGYTKASNCK